MRTKLHLFFVVVIAVIFFSAGCDKVKEKSPSEVVKAVYMAANEGKYSETEQYISPQALELLKGELGALSGGYKGIWDKATRNGTIERIEIMKEEIRGEGAKVKFKIYFKDGKTEDDDASLIKDGGAWKITG